MERSPKLAAQQWNVQMGERTMSLTLPPMLEPQMYLPPIRTTLKASASPKPSPSKLSGIRKVTHDLHLHLPILWHRTCMPAHYIPCTQHCLHASLLRNEL